MVKETVFLIKLMWISNQTIFIIMFQQLINPITLKTVTNCYIFQNRIFYELLLYVYTIKEWNNLSPEICKSVLYKVFKNSLLKFIRPTLNSLFNISDRRGVKFRTRLRLDLSQLRKHKLNHHFQDTINLVL